MALILMAYWNVLRPIYLTADLDAGLKEMSSATNVPINNIIRLAIREELKRLREPGTRPLLPQSDN